MSWWIYLILFVFGYFIYSELTDSSSSSSNSNSNSSSQYQRRSTGRASNYSEDREKQSFVQSAQRQENMGNYDEASRLYLRAGQVFSAAKMKALQGPRQAKSAVELIQINSPDRAELITRNLANDFFYRLEKPAIAASLLRGLGLDEEAEAVEVAAGLNVAQNYEEPIETTSSTVSNPASTEMSRSVAPTSDVEFSSDVDENISETLSPASEDTSSKTKDNYPNSMMMASTIMSDNCSVCKRNIKSGDSFIYCLNCGKPGHYSHLGEMIKVTGKCPVCKERLAPTMYEI